MSASTGWKWPTVDKKCCWQKQQEQRRRKQLNSCCLWPLDLDNKVEYVDQKNMYSKEFNIYWFRIFQLNYLVGISQHPVNHGPQHHECFSKIHTCLRGKASKNIIFVIVSYLWTETLSTVPKFDPRTSWKVGFAPAKENLDEIIGKDEIALLAL